MFDSWQYFIVMGVLLILTNFVLPPLLAARKGYAWYLWTISSGFLGLAILAFLPYANKATVSNEVNQSRRKSGNTIGAVLSSIGLLGIAVQLIVISVAFSGRSHEEDTASRLLQTLLLQAPLVIVYVLGLVFALITLTKHPAQSLLILAACGSMVLIIVLRTALYEVLPYSYLMERGWEIADVQAFYRAVAGISYLLEAVGWLLVLFAALTGRGRASKGAGEAVEALAA